MEKPELYVPVLRYFTNENSFSGSYGNLRFFLKPEEDKIRVKLWHGLLCMDKSEIDEEAEFPLSEEGLTQLKAFLNEKKE